MTWYVYLRRLAIELVLFFIVCTAVFYVVNSRESLAAAINMAIIATLFYGAVTYILRQRTIRKQDER